MFECDLKSLFEFNRPTVINGEQTYYHTDKRSLVHLNVHKSNEQTCCICIDLSFCYCQADVNNLKEHVCRFWYKEDSINCWVSNTISQSLIGMISRS